MYKNILVKDINKVRLIELNRPKSLNALNRQVLVNFKESLVQINQNKEILGLIITGSGEKAFVAGADIKEMLSLSTDEAKSFSELGQEVTSMMEALEIPVIACVNGFALGGGLEMALGADFIYCSSNAVFGLPEVKLGLIPGFGGTQRLARVIGRNIARELVYTGRNVSAEEAVKLRLVNKLFETTDEMIEEAQSVLYKIQRNSIFAIGQAKMSINNGVDLSIDEGLKKESSIFAKLFGSFDAKEGTEAFVEKRNAKFEHIKGDK